MNSKIMKMGLASLVLLLTSQCAVQFYPRKVTRSDKFKSNLAYSIDTFAAALLRDTLAHKAKKPENQKLLLDSYMFYADPRFHDPKNFYPEPGTISDMKMELFKDEKDYQIFYCQWASLYKPVNPDFWKLYNNYQEDWKVYALYFKHKKPVKAAMVMTHGWTGGDIRKLLQQRTNRVTRPVELGFDVLLIQQPYHGPRAPKGSFFSGSMFISSEVSRLNEAMCQAVTDMRSGIRWLKSREYQIVGMYGGSLGGVVTLATAVAEPKLDFAVAWVPPSSWAELTSNSQLVPYVVQGVWDAGIGFETAREIFYPTSPANFKPAIAKEDILLIAGMGDNFVPVNQPILVWESWGKPPIHWFPGGHVMNYGIKDALKVEDEFFARQLAKLDKAAR